MIRFSPSTIRTKPAFAGFRNKGDEKPGFGITAVFRYVRYRETRQLRRNRVSEVYFINLQSAVTLNCQLSTLNSQLLTNSKLKTQNSKLLTNSKLKTPEKLTHSRTTQNSRSNHCCFSLCCCSFSIQYGLASFQVKPIPVRQNVQLDTANS